MKKEKYYKFLYFIAILLIAGFLIRVGADYLKYNPIENSAPFYAYIILRSVEFILPSCIIITIAQIIKKNPHD